MKPAVSCQYLILLIVLATVFGACQIVAPTPLGELPVSMAAVPTTDATEPSEVASTNTDTKVDSPEIEPAAPPPELALEMFAGLWEHGCIYYEMNADGAYKAWNGRPQPGGFPKEAGNLELNGTLLTFHSGDDGLLCRNQSGTYEVIAWSSDEFELALVADECAPREGGPIGVYRRAPEQDNETEMAASPATADAIIVEEDVDLPYAIEHLPDGSTQIWTLDRYRPTQPDDTLTVVHFFGAGGVKDSEAFLARALAMQGAEVLVVDYPDVQVDMALEDERDGFRRMLQTGACAIHFAHGDSGLIEEPNPVVLTGFSLGGGLAAQLALSGDDLAKYWDFFTAHQGDGVSQITCESNAVASHVHGLVGFAGAYDAFVGHEGKWGREWLEMQDPEFLEFLQSSVGMDPKLVIHLFHGDSDGVIPFENSQAFSDFLREAGYQVDLVEFPGDHDIPVDLLEEAIAGLARNQSP